MALTQQEKKAMKHPNVLSAWARKRELLPAKSKQKVVMAEFHKGILHSSDGSIVKNPMQAVAISYSEAERHKKKMKSRLKK